MMQRTLASIFLLFFSSPEPSHADDQEVSVTVTARIPFSCKVSNTTPNLNLGELSRAGAASVSFQVSCNAPFHYALSSRNGSLAQTAGVRAKPPFFSSLPYTVNYSLGTSAGMLVDTCLSSNMLATATTCSGRSTSDAIAIQQTATIGFSWDPHGSFPVAGSYADTVTVTLSAGL
jgi:spore coat protein U-like protein